MIFWINDYGEIKKAGINVCKKVEFISDGMNVWNHNPTNVMACCSY
jgi:hypothetical protein